MGLPPASDLRMDDLLDMVVSEGASDLHLTVGRPPVLRIHGSLQSIETESLTPADTERLMLSIATKDNVRKIREEGGCDFGFGFGDRARFRVSLFRQRGCTGIVMRLIPSVLMTLDQIGLPSQIRELLFRPRGLILVTGPTGCGKTTTLASMIDIINETRDCHIITIEDPIEYQHPHKRAVVTQREIGADVPGFREALRRSLRQDPDVILVGEMRDLETMEAAITAAETGHLVFATLHTTGATRTVDRIVDAFPTDRQAQIRTQLSSTLQAVISQVLIPRVDVPGRIAAFEVMINTPAIAALIRDSKTFRIKSDIQTGGRLGMFTLDESLFNHYKAGRISYEDLVTKCDDREAIDNRLDETGRRGKR